MWYSHPLRYYSAVKMNEVLIHNKTWMNLETTELNETKQTQNKGHRRYGPIYMKSQNR